MKVKNVADWLENLFDELSKPLLPKQQVFEVKQARRSGANAVEVELHSKKPDYPPYFVRLQKSRGMSNFEVGYKLPKKIPAEQQGWSLYFSFQRYYPYNLLVQAINDGEAWALEHNRFTKDGNNGPADWIMDDIVKAIRKYAGNGFSGKTKRELLEVISKIESLVKKDASGRLVFETLPSPIVPVKKWP